MALVSKWLGILMVSVPVLLSAPPGKSVMRWYTQHLSLLQGSRAAAPPYASASPLCAQPVQQSVAERLGRRTTSCKVFAYVYFFLISAVGPWFYLWHQMLLITVLTDEGTPPLPWLLLLNFCLRSWSSWQAFSLCRMPVEAEQAVILGAYWGCGVGCLPSVLAKFDSYVIQPGPWVARGALSWRAA